MSFVYINGKLVKKEEAYISVLDHGFLYGDGIFETMRSYRGKVYLLDKHIDRLFESAKRVFINIPMSRTEIGKEIYNTLTRNSLDEAYIRLTISRGYGDTGIAPGNCSSPTIVIYVKQFIPYPAEWYKDGIRIINIKGNNPLATIKSCNYLNNILARIKASQYNATEAILINDKGYVTEGTVSNIFAVRGGTLLTPSLNEYVLPGITRGKVIHLAMMGGIDVEERSMAEEDILSSEECFLTNTLFEILPVRELHIKKRWDECPGRITSLLTKMFREDVETLSATI